MGIESYNTNPDLNTNQLGMATGNNALNVGNVDNALRKLMADIATFYQAWSPLIAQITGKQAGSLILSALAGAGATADRLPYYTASDQAALTPITAFIRTLLDDTSAPTARVTLGAIGIVAGALTNPGYVQLSVPTLGNLMIQWGFGSIGSNTTGTITYPQAFGSFSVCIPTGGSANPADEGGVRTNSSTLGSAAICDPGPATTYWWVAVGV